MARARHITPSELTPTTTVRYGGMEPPHSPRQRTLPTQGRYLASVREGWSPNAKEPMQAQSASARLRVAQGGRITPIAPERPYWVARYSPETLIRASGK